MGSIKSWPHICARATVVWAASEGSYISCLCSLFSREVKHYGDREPEVERGPEHEIMDEVISLRICFWWDGVLGTWTILSSD